MDDELALIIPGVVAILLILTIGGVILLKPISNRLGELLEAMTKERKEGTPRLREHLAQIRDHLEAHHERLQLMEERLDFTEELVRRSSDARSLEAGESGAREGRESS